MDSRGFSTSVHIHLLCSALQLQSSPTMLLQCLCTESEVCMRTGYELYELLFFMGLPTDSFRVILYLFLYCEFDLQSLGVWLDQSTGIQCPQGSCILARPLSLFRHTTMQQLTRLQTTYIPPMWWGAGVNWELVVTKAVFASCIAIMILFTALCNVLLHCT